MTQPFQEAVGQIKAGKLQTGRQLLVRELTANPANEAAWLWLAAIIESDEKRRECLEMVLAINPNHPQAKYGLALLRQKKPPRYKIIQTICAGLDEAQDDRLETLADGFKLAWPAPIPADSLPGKSPVQRAWQTIQTVYSAYNPFSPKPDKPNDNPQPQPARSRFQLKPVQDPEALASIFQRDLKAELMADMDPRTRQLLSRLPKSGQTRPHAVSKKLAWLAVGLGLASIMVILVFVVMLLG